MANPIDLSRDPQQAQARRFRQIEEDNGYPVKLRQAGGASTGPAGPTGANGATWLSGAGAPGGGEGSNGDFYLRTSNEDVYKKVAGVWGVITNIKGEKGEVGEVGEKGAAGASQRFIGEPFPWPNPAAPTVAEGEVAKELNGEELSRATFAALFSVLAIITTGNRVSASKSIKAIPSTTGMVAGMPISGTGIKAGTTIETVNSGVEITLSQTAESTATGGSIQVCPHGVGNGTTTFNLPDWRGRSPVGVGTHADVNRVGQNDAVTVASRTPKHTHGVTGTTSGGNAEVGAAAGVLGVETNAHTHTFSVTSAAGFAPYAATKWFMRVT